MAKTLKSLGYIGLLFGLAVMVSCSDRSSSAAVLSGNMSYGRGSYQRAILQYLNAAGHQSAGKDVVLYNLANVYYALGEGDAALQAWAQAESGTSDVEILFRVAFNRGVLYYNWGRYDEAYRSFRRALELRPRDIDAKVSLEESLSRIRAAVAAPSSGNPSPQIEDGAAGNPDSLRLLDYVKRKEAGTWSAESGEQTEYTEDW